jgi:hypothetical protein
MRTLTINETEEVGGQGIIAVPVYYGAVALIEAAPAILCFAAGFAGTSAIILGGYFTSLKN